MADTPASPQVVQWILDTRDLWPEARQSRDLQTHASRALALLNHEDQEKVFRNYHVRDAKMVLCSHLLKHYLIARFCGVPWREIKLTRDSHKKPIYRDPVTGRLPVAFNVSHQAGLVALVAVYGYDDAGGGRQVDVGVDVVCTSERRDRDLKSVEKEGWPGFVDVYADVFARSEVNYLKYQILAAVPGAPSGPGTTQEDIVDFKLRCFYTIWCLREAYVKMTAEALLAEWLGALEFRNFVPPAPTAAFDVPAGEDGPQVVRGHDIYFRGQKVDDANVCLRALGPDYILATAVRTAPDKADGLKLKLGPFDMLSIDDILSFAESRL
ncbi:4'-phosphopantetheinyl transferase [Coniochaeta ligniaria NRRL 30616]|uniref:holo-[acyl-carrier-protein] synthase n=1 Tax=Coniochaeta ligniaria NRRL 30616 TaxID=1408157 RepID=A0A1J7IU23_9PEZI|nr:4'-phosphopantetheinyl transferase [Coniochaeta ligniaria NRRL 30616]